MALARLALKHVQRRVLSSFPSAAAVVSSSSERITGGKEVMFKTTARGFSDDTTGSSEKGRDEKSGEGGEREVAVAEGGGKKSKLFSRSKQHRRGSSLWKRNRGPDFVPSFFELFPMGLGNAVMQATENLNRLLENWAPSRLIGRLKEKDECYKLRYEVPGVAKEELKITVEDGVLRIKGEHKETSEEEGFDDDEGWSSSLSYGFYDATLVLPEDAKVDGIKAEMKDGVLYITIPRTVKDKKDVKEVQIH
ncbi:26.5 kDa heat shock protein, mitochondrial [Malania oleifera]|uniref:26.5 kDa heat shock protein, mitochondrial n=1 Tax=Malania oleifera TaxID=397392 RepID=UPI0025AE6D45|nr:26.5 kDa heat shock protein, mitochondrial [Malania oleifera]